MFDLPAQDLQPGDCTLVFRGQPATIARVDRARPGFVRVVACLGYRLTDEPDVSVILPADTLTIVTRGEAAA